MRKRPNSERNKCSEEFGKYMRLKRCLETTGYAFLGACITCGRQFHIRYLQAGHAISGRRNTVLLMERLVHAQCNYCNMVDNGKLKKFTRILREKYGEKMWDRLYALSKKTIPDNCINWSARRERYKRKCETVMRNHGFRTWSEILKG